MIGNANVIVEKRQTKVAFDARYGNSYISYYKHMQLGFSDKEIEKIETLVSSMPEITIHISTDRHNITISKNREKRSFSSVSWFRKYGIDEILQLHYEDNAKTELIAM